MATSIKKNKRNKPPLMIKSLFLNFLTNSLLSKIVNISSL